ncbi:phage tail protein [Citrobacter braakii]|uniref:phage tail protein n=3 Tax=Citrobacter TaxID=544 RepID=UPI00200032F3|nr:phage tail protein [Citrobacter braakii]MCK2155265.1 phage tail protein [Citrobacter braakii]
MAAKFFALLTNQGAAKLSNMAALGEKLEITSLAVGDGGGISPTPNQAQTALVNEVRRAQLNSLSVDDKNASQIIAEQIIPESSGGWWIREIGLFDADGILIAVANCPETYKATTEEGSGRTQVIRMMLTVSSTDAVTLKVDPSVVLATRQYVDSAVIEVKTYTDNAMKKHVAAANPHSQYLLIENALKELAEAGLVGDVLKNLGLGEGSALPVGVPVPWPLPTPPQGWLKYNGAPFDKNIYPKLGAIYPGGVLPDLRGEFVRGWDDGRGINTGRALLSSEADMNKSHGHLFESSMDGGTTWGNANPYIDFNAGNSVSHTPNNIFVQVLRAQIGGAGAGWEGINNTGVRNQLSGGNESRPRNIAFNYIVRAA